MPVPAPLRRIGRAALDLVLPPRCPGCREIVEEPARLCGACWATLGFLTDPSCARCGLPFEIEAGAEAVCGECAGTVRPYDRLRAAVRYEGAAVPVLMGFKHGGRTHLARLMGELMRRHLPADPAITIPIPLDRRRLRQRGYNQAAVLARTLSPQVDVDLLARTKPTPSTAGMSRAQRFRSAAGAFAATRKLAGAPSVLLIDDVMTTGATVEAAAKALKRAGAGRVDVLVFARALRDDA
ncbi:MAG: ComF family protein [Pseudomonadota bacterium]